MQNALARMQLKKAQGDMDEEAAFKNALAGVQGGDYQTALPGLIQASPTRGLALSKQLLDQRKSDLESKKLTAEIGDKLLEVQDRAAGAFAANPTRESGAYALQWMAQQGMPADVLANMKARLKATPDEQLPALAQQFLAGTKDGIKQLAERQFATPKVVELGLGGQRAVQTIDPATGKVLTDQRYGVSMSPGEAAADSRARAALAQNEQHFQATQGAGKIPPGYRATEGGLEAIPGGPADLKRQGAYNTDTAALQGSSAQLDRLSVEANRLLNSPGLSKSTGLMSIVPVVGGVASMPGGDAANFKAGLDTLKSQVGFSVLQTMRDMSKTGGALGAVSDRENAMLQNNLAALDRAQSEQEFRASLQRIIDYAEQAKGRLREAYNMKHGTDSAAGGQGVPAATATATAPPAAAPAPKKLRFDAQGNIIP